MKKIAIYGKGGIGKSTTSSNLAAALSKNYRVMLIGCDPKADSSVNLLGGRKIDTVLDVIRNKEEDTELDDLINIGYNGVICVESGGPTPGIGCAGLGIITAFQRLDRLKAFDFYKPDIVIYDVLGDVVCGGFAMPIRDGYAEDIFIVTSGEMMALYAADNIARAVSNFESRGYARCAGIILNARNVKDEDELVTKAAREMNTEVIYKVPRSSDVQKAEDENKTVVEAFPDSEQAREYVMLSEKIIQRCEENARLRQDANKRPERRKIRR